RLDALLHQPQREINMVRGTLAADADVLAFRPACGNRAQQQLFDSRIAFVETFRHQAGVAIQAQRELREVVRTDRKTVEEFQKLLGEQGVGWNLAHHDHAQTIFTTAQSISSKQL